MLDLFPVSDGLGHGSSSRPGLTDHTAEGQEQRGQDRNATDDLERQKKPLQRSEIVLCPVRLACFGCQELADCLPQRVHSRFGPVQMGELPGFAGASRLRRASHLGQLGLEMGDERGNGLGAWRTAGHLGHEPIKLVQRRPVVIKNLPSNAIGLEIVGPRGKGIAPCATLDVKQGQLHRSDVAALGPESQAILVEPGLYR